MFQAIILFILAGLAEIGGGYLIWQWIREGKPLSWGIAGGLILALYGVLQHSRPSRLLEECMLHMEVCLSFCPFYGDGA